MRKTVDHKILIQAPGWTIGNIKLLNIISSSSK